MYNSNISARRPDVYDPGQADVQPSGCTVPIVVRGDLMCMILDKLMYNPPDVTS